VLQRRRHVTLPGRDERQVLLDEGGRQSQLQLLAQPACLLEVGLRRSERALERVQDGPVGQAALDPLLVVGSA
jgi:hypothetical protein